MPAQAKLYPAMPAQAKLYPAMPAQASSTLDAGPGQFYP